MGSLLPQNTRASAHLPFIQDAREERLVILHSLDVGSAIEVLKSQHAWLVGVLYVGPDQILPLTSFLGAIIGILLIFWRYVVSLAGRVWQLLFRR
jgi:hypothetical protein